MIEHERRNEMEAKINATQQARTSERLEVHKDVSSYFRKWVTLDNCLNSEGGSRL